MDGEPGVHMPSIDLLQHKKCTDGSQAGGLDSSSSTASGRAVTPFCDMKLDSNLIHSRVVETTFDHTQLSPALIHDPQASILHPDPASSDRGSSGPDYSPSKWMVTDPGIGTPSPKDSPQLDGTATPLSASHLSSPLSSPRDGAQAIISSLIEPQLHSLQTGVGRSHSVDHSSLKLGEDSEDTGVRESPVASALQPKILHVSTRFMDNTCPKISETTTAFLDAQMPDSTSTSANLASPLSCPLALPLPRGLQDTRNLSSTSQLSSIEKEAGKTCLTIPSPASDAKNEAPNHIVTLVQPPENVMTCVPVVTPYDLVETSSLLVPPQVHQMRMETDIMADGDSTRSPKPPSPEDIVFETASEEVLSIPSAESSVVYSQEFISSLRPEPAHFSNDNNSSTLSPSHYPLEKPIPSTPSKRPRDGKEPASPDQLDVSRKSTKRPRNSSNQLTLSHPPPVPHQIARLKLSQPFRSPLFSKPALSPNTPRPLVTNNDSDGASSLKSTLNETVSSIITPKPKQLSRLHSEAPLSSRTPSGSENKNTKAVSRPFKSPFKSPLSSLSSSTSKSVTSPNIQSLERKLQLLKRAVRIRADGEEEKLEALTAKWRTVGREVAWEMWAAVRDQGQSDGWGGETEKKKSTFGGQKSGWGWDETAAPMRQKKGSHFDSNWGYADPSDNRMRPGEETMDENGTWEPPSPSKLEADLWKTIRKTNKKPMSLTLDLDSAIDTEQRDKAEVQFKRETESCGASVIAGIEDNEDEPEEAKHTLGTMLKQFGIADETLGWDEEEEDFVVHT